MQYYNCSTNNCSCSPYGPAFYRAPGGKAHGVQSKSGSSLDSDSWVQIKSDSSLDSGSWVQIKSDSPLDSDSWVQIKSDSPLDSDSWLARAAGLAGGTRHLSAGLRLGKEQPPSTGRGQVELTG
jgi:hypothetical protein